MVKLKVGKFEKSDRPSVRRIVQRSENREIGGKEIIR